MSVQPNARGLLLEGISGTGKSTLLRALLESPRFRSGPDLSTIVLTEHQTQRILEKKERDTGLTVSDNLGLLTHHIAYLESLQNRLDTMDWCRTDAVGMRVRFVLERFHLTHVYHYAHISWDMVRSIDRRLGDLSCGLCLITADEHVLSDRIFNNRDPEWMAYIERFGSSKSEILHHFLKQQDQILNLASKSILRTTVIDTGKKDVNEIVSEILDDWSRN